MAALTQEQVGGQTTDEILALFSPGEGSCTFDSSGAYEDPVFEGAYDLWVDCGGVGTVYAVVVAYPIDGRGGAFVLVFQAVTDADLDVMAQVLDTFNYT